MASRPQLSAQRLLLQSSRWRQKRTPWPYATAQLPLQARKGQRRRWASVDSSATASASQAVSDQEIVHLANVPLHPLSLSDLVKYGRPPLSPQSLLASARFTLSLLPTRLAHRLHAIRSLPYIVVSNPHISAIYHNYLHSLGTLLPFYRVGIETLADEAAFIDALADLVQTHANTIPTLARGLKECGRYLGDGEGRIGSRFIDQHLRARIGTRLVAEQHLALHLASNPLPPSSLQDGGDEITGTGGGGDGGLQHQPGQQEQLLQHQGEDHGSDGAVATMMATPENFVGIIDTALSPVSVLRRCEDFVGELCELKYGVRPSVVLRGNIDARIAHIPTHLEYVLTELLKNAFRATIERGRERDPIEVTLAMGRDDPSSCNDDGDGDGNQAPNNTTQTAVAPGSIKDGGQGGVAITMPANGAAMAGSSLTLRIRDQGGGIAPEVLPKIWDYSFTTFVEEERYGAGGLATLSASGAEGGGTLAGLGYGLPLGRAYAEHFGGELNVESLWGWGTDVYLRLKGLEMGVS